MYTEYAFSFFFSNQNQMQSVFGIFNWLHLYTVHECGWKFESDQRQVRKIFLKILVMVITINITILIFKLCYIDSQYFMLFALHVLCWWIEILNIVWNIYYQKVIDVYHVDMGANTQYIRWPMTTSIPFSLSNLAVKFCYA